MNPEAPLSCRVCSEGYYITGDGLCFNNKRSETWIGVLVLMGVVLLIVLAIVFYKRCILEDDVKTDSYFSVE